MRAAGTAVLTPIRFSLATGHWRSSIATNALSAQGAPLPWYTYPAIDFLAQRNFTDRRVLEFGGGQSTSWWAQRASQVVTIEEDQAWYENLKARVSGNVELHHVPADLKTRDVSAIRDILDNCGKERFDVIVVDGHLRREAAAMAFDYLGPDGALILDNAEGYGFYDEIRSRTCRRVDFYGFAPGVSKRHCTSLVFLDKCFLLDPEAPIVNLETATD